MRGIERGTFGTRGSAVSRLKVLDTSLSESPYRSTHAAFGIDDAISFAARHMTAAVIAMSITLPVSATANAADASAYARAFAGGRVNYTFPSIFAHARAEMNEYRHLEDGWDGPGSIAPIAGVIDDAQAFLAALPISIRSPEASVSSDGSVEWFWHSDRASAAVLFPSKGRLVYYAEAKGAEKAARGSAQFDRGALPQDLVDVLIFA